MKASITGLLVLLIVNFTISYVMTQILGINPDYVIFVVIVSSLCWPYTFKPSTAKEIPNEDDKRPLD
jgi:hypothetical protein